MYIVGIDIAKRKHEAAVIDGEGTVIIKPFSFTNNCSGYNRLLAMLAKVKLPLDEVSFAMEATGHYWLALFTRLQKEGFRVQVINPVQTNSIRSFYIRQAKTDPRDALLIAEVIRFGHFSESTLHPENIYELRELCRGRHAIVSMQADVKRKVVALLDQVFPEYETAFTNLFGDTSWQFCKPVLRQRNYLKCGLRSFAISSKSPATSASAWQKPGSFRRLRTIPLASPWPATFSAR